MTSIAVHNVKKVSMDNPERLEENSETFVRHIRIDTEAGNFEICLFGKKETLIIKII